MKTFLTKQSVVKIACATLILFTYTQTLEAAPRGGAQFPDFKHGGGGPSVGPDRPRPFPGHGGGNHGGNHGHRPRPFPVPIRPIYPVYPVHPVYPVYPVNPPIYNPPVYNPPLYPPVYNNPTIQRTLVLNRWVQNESLLLSALLNLGYNYEGYRVRSVYVDASSSSGGQIDLLINERIVDSKVTYGGDVYLYPSMQGDYYNISTIRIGVSGQIFINKIVVDLGD